MWPHRLGDVAPMYARSGCTLEAIPSKTERGSKLDQPHQALLQFNWSDGQRKFTIYATFILKKVHSSELSPTIAGSGKERLVSTQGFSLLELTVKARRGYGSAWPDQECLLGPPQEAVAVTNKTNTEVLINTSP